MNPRIRPWTAEEDSTAIAMRRDGACPMLIADALKRTRAAVYARLLYLELPAEKRLQKNQAKRVGRTLRAKAVVRERITPSNNKLVPPAVLEERARRRDAPQPAFGDPPVGFSALDRKQSGVSA